MNFTFQTICLVSHYAQNLMCWNMPKTLPPRHLSDIICIVADKLIKFLECICRMLSHVSTDQLHYDKNYIIIAYHIMSRGEGMPYIL